jgi:hypothetical protein
MLITIDDAVKDSILELSKEYKLDRWGIYDDYLHYSQYFDRTENEKADLFKTEREYDDYLRIRTLLHLEALYKRKNGI